MTWTKLSDDYTDDCWTLSDAAYRMHSEGLVWSNRKLLDLRIPKDDLPRFSRNGNAQTAAELIAHGFWTDEGDHWQIRHHAAYQRTKAEVVKQQEANARNGAKGGRPRKAPREVWDGAETHSVNDSLSESKSERDGTGSGPWTGRSFP